MLFSALSYGLLATSLLSSEALAGRFDARKRALIVEDVIVSQAITVLANPDGTFVTLDPVNIGTTTIDSTAAVASSTVVPATTAPVRVVDIPSPVVAIQLPSTSDAAPVAPSPTSSTRAIVPTTFATSTSKTPVPTTTSTNGAKRGLAYNSISLLSGFVGTGSQATWCYNWGAGPDGSVPGALEYVPMLWGLGSDSTSGWDKAVTTALKSGSSHLLAFNEPDLGTQANIGYEDAAKGYMQWMQKYAGQAKLGSPAVTNGPASSGMGVGYLSNFITACEGLGCTIDFVAIHWYSDAANTQDFKDHVTKSYAAGGNRPIWITEIGATGTAAQQQTFLNEVLPWLDAQSFVERYAYFMVAEGSLVSGTGLSALGKTFAFSL